MRIAKLFLALYKAGVKQAEIVATDSAVLFAEAVRRAAAALRAGEVVAVPTETVYGLAANALDPRAVEKIFAVKRRPAVNPVIVHIVGLEMARRCVTSWPAAAERLAAAFWPGPLTLILPRSSEMPDVVTAGGSTVGVRWPAHPFIQALIRECGFPLAAPSANLSNRVSPTTAEHVQKSLGRNIGLIVDGGQSHVGIESTVLDLCARAPRVLRPGMIHAESLFAVLGGVEGGGALGGSATGGALRSPGQLPKHYSPQAKLVVLRWEDDVDLRAKVKLLGVPEARVHVVAHTVVPLQDGFGRVSVIPHDAQAFARAIYGELHRGDEEGAQLIVIEEVPATPEWQGIVDRLRRAEG